MATLSAFYPYVLPVAPGVPEFAVDRALVDSAIQFCRDTWVWQEEIDPIVVEAGTSLVEIEPESRANILAVVRAVVGDDVMYPAEASDEHRLAFFHGDGASLRVSPELSGTLRVRLALEPRQGDTSIADTLFDEWREVIAAGALSRMLLSSGDTERAGLYIRIFQDGLARARAHKAATRSKRRIRTTPVR